jgi:hypothetical protein
MRGTLTQPLPFPARTDVDERAARAAMRDQIARLEDQLAGHVTTAFPRSPTPPRIGGSDGARLQTLAELEHRRDSLQAAVAQAARGRMEAIMLDPAAHRWERVSHEDIGEPGCRQCHARPRLGLIGLLMNWWRVIVSSGCPLCMQSAAPLR